MDDNGHDMDEATSPIEAALTWAVAKSRRERADFPGAARILKDIAVPTLLIHGRNDPYIPLEHARRMDEDIPDSELVIIERGAHFLPIDTPQEVAAALSAFLSPEEAP